MQKTSSIRYGALTALLLGAVVIGVLLSSGVFGGTGIGITLRTNPNLEEGLVAHLTFDKNYDEFGIGQGDLLFASTTERDGFNAAAYDIELANGMLFVTYNDGTTGSAYEIARLEPGSLSYVWASTTDVEVRALHSDGGFLYMTGSCYNCGDAGSANAIHTAKMNISDGSLVWATTTDPSPTTDGGLALTTLDGDVFVAGYCGTFFGTGDCIGVNESAFYVMRIGGSSGNMVWATTTDLSAANDAARSIATDGVNIFVTGQCGANFVDNCPGGDDKDIYTMKIDAANGDLLWATSTNYGGGNLDEGFVALYKDDSLYVVGRYVGGGSGDNFIMEVDPGNGDMVWATSTGSMGTNVSALIDAALWNEQIVVTTLQTPASYVFSTDILNAEDGSLSWSTTTNTNEWQPPINVTTDANYAYVSHGDSTDFDIENYVIDLRQSSSDGLAGSGDTPVPGVLGQGVEFDGVDDYIRLGPTLDPTDEQLTLAAWVKVDNTSQDATIAGKRENAPNDGYSLSYRGDLAGDPWRFTIFGVVDQDSDSSTVRTDEWYHVAVTYDKQNITFYENGELLSSHAQTGEVDDASSLDLIIGARNQNGDPATGTFFDGSMDDVRIYSRALSAEDISRLYDLGATTKINKTLDTNSELRDGLLLHYTFDGPDTNFASNTAEIIDISTQGLNGNWFNHSSTSVPGVLGSALQFTDAVDDYVFQSDSILDPTDVSVSLWFNAEVWDGYILSHSLPAPSCWSSNYHVALSATDEVTFSFGNSSTIHRTVDQDLQINKWYHFVGLMDQTNDQVRMYLNGEEVYSASESNSNGGSGRDLFIGNCSSSGGYQGSLDDVRIYDRILEETEIERLYELGATTKINKTLATNPDLERGLVGHWSFDGQDIDLGDVSSEIIDRSSSADHGNWINHATSTTPGIMGQAIELDGGDDQIDVSSYFASNGSDVSSGTVSGWMYMKGSQQNQSIFKFRTRYTQLEAQLLADNGSGRTQFRVLTLGDSLVIASSTAPEYGVWQHFAGTFDGDSTKLYINGEVVDENTTSRSGNFSSVASRSTRIGCGNFSATAPPECRAWAEGLIDDVRIYKRALSAEEILRLYQLGN